MNQSNGRMIATANAEVGVYDHLGIESKREKSKWFLRKL